MVKDYKEIKKIGEGGFGEVFLIQKKCALKQFNKTLEEEEKDRIKNMINTINKINNEHIIKYYDTYEEDNKFNILMEYGGEMNLKQYIEHQKDELIEENIIKDIILQICIGIKEIHKNNIIHRDLTPDNIFINKNNKIKIGDFDISKINKDYVKTQIGKIQYLAPEIILGNKYNNKIDIYLLGCIIYELLTLNNYYIDTKINNNNGKININIYNPKWQNLLDLLLNKEYKNRPNIDEVYKYIKDEIIINNKSIKYNNIQLNNNKLEEFNKKYNLNIQQNTTKINLNFKEIGNEGLKDLCQIEFKELKELFLYNNISDIKVLENVKFEKLEILNLGKNKISDINILKN